MLPQQSNPFDLSADDMVSIQSKKKKQSLGTSPIKMYGKIRPSEGRFVFKKTSETEKHKLLNDWSSQEMMMNEHLSHFS